MSDALAQLRAALTQQGTGAANILSGGLSDYMAGAAGIRASGYSPITLRGSHIDGAGFIKGNWAPHNNSDIISALSNIYGAVDSRGNPVTPQMLNNMANFVGGTVYVPQADVAGIPQPSGYDSGLDSRESIDSGKSGFVGARDFFEGAGVMAGNYFLPVSSLITSHLVSKGAQENLADPIFGTINTALGAAGTNAGNMGNYGKIFDGINNALPVANGTPAPVSAPTNSGALSNLFGHSNPLDYLRVFGNLNSPGPSNHPVSNGIPQDNSYVSPSYSTNPSAYATPRTIDQATQGSLNMKRGGLAMAGFVSGNGGGQDDLIPANLADGEYVLDADVVSALGDGSNKEGAKKLDEFRKKLRAHKRSAGPGSIPAKAKSINAYMGSR